MGSKSIDGYTASKQETEYNSHVMKINMDANMNESREKYNGKSPLGNDKQERSRKLRRDSTYTVSFKETLVEKIRSATEREYIQTPTKLRHGDEDTTPNSQVRMLGDELVVDRGRDGLDSVVIIKKIVVSKTKSGRRLSEVALKRSSLSDVPALPDIHIEAEEKVASWKASHDRKPKKDRRQSLKREEMPLNHHIIQPSSGDEAIVVLDGISASTAFAEGRLKAVNGASTRKRKNASILNDQVNGRYLFLAKSIDKQKQLTDAKYQKDTEPLRKSLVELRGTSVCLKKIREDLEKESTEKTPRYGLYQGQSIREMKPTMNKILADSHPQVRRSKEMSKLLTDGYKDGRLMDPVSAMKKFSDIFNKPYKPFPLIPKKYIISRQRGSCHLPKIGFGPKMLEQHSKGYSNFFNSAGMAYVPNLGI